MNGFEVIGGRGYLALGGHQEFLVAAVDELRDLTINKVAGSGEDLHAVFILRLLRLLNGGRDAVLLNEDALLRPGCFQDVEAVITQPLDGFVEAALLNLSRHDPYQPCSRILDCFSALPLVSGLTYTKSEHSRTRFR